MFSFSNRAAATDVRPATFDTARLMGGAGNGYAYSEMQDEEYCIYNYLEQNYQFRRNAVTEAIEVRELALALEHPETPWERCEDRHFNTMCIRAKRGTGLPNATVSAIMAYANSAYTPSYHPIKDYLLGLEWDEQDHIGQLAALVETENGGVWSQYLRCWMIRAVAQVLNGSANEYMLVLAGAQGIGKTTFARALVPRGMEEYSLFRKIEHGKDGQSDLCASWIIVDDELVGLKKAAVEAIKATLSSTRQTYRPPYGRTTITRPRMASFIGATNESEFLVDPSGARRFLAITMLGADLDALRSFNIAGAWAQAVALYQSGEQGFLTPELVEAQTKLNDQMGEETMYDHYIRQYVAASTSRDTWVNATTIAEFINVKCKQHGSGFQVTRKNVQEVAKALRKAGHKQDTNGVKVWKVRLKGRYERSAPMRDNDATKPPALMTLAEPESFNAES